MTEYRYNEVFSHGVDLNDQEIAQGWHFCWEWDGLLVGPGMHELEPCHCLPEPLLSKLKDGLPKPEPMDWHMLDGGPMEDQANKIPF